MNNERGWKFWGAVIASGVTAVGIVLGALMGRIAWPFDLLMQIVGT